MTPESHAASNWYVSTYDGKLVIARRYYGNVAGTYEDYHRDPKTYRILTYASAHVADGACKGLNTHRA